MHHAPVLADTIIKSRYKRFMEADVICTSLFSDGYFDLVYLDADHRYEAVKDDSAVWLPIGRKSETLAGHDCHASDGRHPAVTRAVDGLLHKTLQRYAHPVWVHHVQSSMQNSK